MLGDFVKIKKRVAVTNQYAAAIRDDKERKKMKKYEIYDSFTLLAGFFFVSFWRRNKLPWVERGRWKNYL
jgi:hypothetical protein